MVGRARYLFSMKLNYTAGRTLEPRRHELMEETHASTQQLPLLLEVNAQGTRELIQSSVAIARAQLQRASMQQHHHINMQFAMIRTYMEEFPRFTAFHEASHISLSTKRYRFRSTRPYHFTFPIGSVTLSWGPLQKRNSSADAADEDTGYGYKLSESPPGFALRIEFVPSPKLSNRTIVAGFRLERDQRGSPSILPYLSCSVTIPHGADILTYAKLGDTSGIEQLFVSRRASVSDRTIEGWTPLHVRFYDSNRYLDYLPLFSLLRLLLLPVRMTVVDFF